MAERDEASHKNIMIRSLANQRLRLLIEVSLVLLLMVANSNQDRPPDIQASSQDQEILPAVEEQAFHRMEAPVIEVDRGPIQAFLFPETEDNTSSSQLTYPLHTTPSENNLREHQDNSLAIEPLKLEFPQRPPQPDTLQRPPLYPIPWSLTPYDHFYFSRPIPADQAYRTVEEYRYGGVFFEQVVHTGLDIVVRPDTPILAAASGKVTWAGSGVIGTTPNPEDPYGIAVLIRHDFGWDGRPLYTLYAHLNRADVVIGQYVNAGQQIGLSGQTGKATGPHLHFEVLIQNGALLSTFNPELWLVPPEGWGVLAARIWNTWGYPVEAQLVTLTSKDSGQRWQAHSYHDGKINSDPYYQENLVIGDLPAGVYEIRIDYLGRRYLLDFYIHPGMVNYFSFLGRNGFVLQLPPPPGSEFVPPFSP